MKKTIFFIVLLINSYSYSQELMNFYIEPSGTDEVTLHTLFYNNTFSTFGNSSVNIEDNIITATLCYLHTSGQAITYDSQTLTINLPAGYSNYTLNVELYGDNDALPPCSLDVLTDIGSLNFNYPLNQTATTYIPDNAFEGYLEDLGFGDDITNNDLVFTHRIVNMTNLFVGIMNISSMVGLQDFVSLRDLRCTNNQITSLDVTNNLNLESLWCSSNLIDEIDVSNNPNLTWLRCNNTNISSIDVTNNIYLEWLEVRNNAISTIDLSQNSELVYLDIDNNLLTELNLDNNVLLVDFRCSNNIISSLNLSSNIYLVNLITRNNNLTNISFNNNSQLEVLNCNENLLTELDLSNLSSLRGFDCTNNQITSVDLSFNQQLEGFNLRFNNLLYLNLKNGNNSNITFIDITQNDNLYCIEVDNPEEAPYPGWYVGSQVVFSEDCSLGIGDQTLQAAIQLYPNPVKNTLQINTENSINIKSIAIFDVLGKKILATKNTDQIDVSTFTSGLLFVKITTDKGIVIKKVVKE